MVVDNPVPKEAIFDLILIGGLSFYHAEWLRDIRRAPWWVAVKVPTFHVWKPEPGIHGGGRECVCGGVTSWKSDTSQWVQEVISNATVKIKTL